MNIVHTVLQACSIEDLERQMKQHPKLKLVSYSYNEGNHRCSLADPELMEKVEEE